MRLVLASAYAGWAGSLPSEIAEQHLKQSLRGVASSARGIRGHDASHHGLGRGGQRLESMSLLRQLLEFHSAGF